MANNGVSTLRQSEFEAAMEAGLVPLMVDEWPEVDRDLLDGAGNDLGEVVEVISTATGRTKTLVKAQLAELAVYAKADDATDTADDLTRMRRMLKNLEAKSQEIAEFARGQMLPQAKEKVQENLVVSLLVAVGLGFLLGFVARSAGRR